MACPHPMSAQSHRADDPNHPPGPIRLGLDPSGQRLELDVSDSAQHVFIPGTSGFGKSTTLLRLLSGRTGRTTG